MCWISQSLRLVRQLFQPPEYFREGHPQPPGKRRHGGEGTFSFAFFDLRDVAVIYFATFGKLPPGEPPGFPEIPDDFPEVYYQGLLFIFCHEQMIYKYPGQGLWMFRWGGGLILPQFRKSYRYS